MTDLIIIGLIIDHLALADGVLGKTQLLSALFVYNPLVGRVLITVLRLERGVV